MKIFGEAAARMMAGIGLASGILGAMPAGAGYSTVVKGEARHASRSNGPVTVGIVTHLQGAAFSKSSGKEESSALELAEGITMGRRVWVETGSRMSVTSPDGAVIRLAGPAVVEFPARGFVLVRNGAVSMRPGGAPFRFETHCMAGEIAGHGAAAFWVSDKIVQVLAVEGVVRAWHPRLERDVVTVDAGWFTESSPAFSYLQPRRPQPVDDSRAKELLAAFGEGAVPWADAKQAGRAIASAPKEKSPAKKERAPASLVEPRDEEALEHLKARISGMEPEEYDGGEDLGREVAAEARGKPRIEVRRKGKMGVEEAELLRKLVPQKK